MLNPDKALTLLVYALNEEDREEASELADELLAWLYKAGGAPNVNQKQFRVLLVHLCEHLTK